MIKAKVSADKYAKDLLDTWQKQNPNIPRPGAIDVIVTQDGLVFYGYSQKAVKGSPLQPSRLESASTEVQALYEYTPKKGQALMNCSYGRCSEVSSLDQAIKAGANLKDAVSYSNLIRGGKIIPYPACVHCGSALDKANITDAVKFSERK